MGCALAGFLECKASDAVSGLCTLDPVLILRWKPSTTLFKHSYMLETALERREPCYWKSEIKRGEEREERIGPENKEAYLSRRERSIQEEVQIGQYLHGHNVGDTSGLVGPDQAIWSDSRPRQKSEHRNERLLDQSIQVPGNISRAIPDWFFPNGTGSSARHQSRPDAVFVRSILGRSHHLDPTKIPPQDRDIHL
eukprot:1141529-Pelagomonas_calceolata.AAC.1